MKEKFVEKNYSPENTEKRRKKAFEKANLFILRSRKMEFKVNILKACIRQVDDKSLICKLQWLT